MASALYNMMVDEDKNKAGAVPPTTTPNPTAPPSNTGSAPMPTPPPSTPPAPAQVGTGGTGAQPPSGNPLLGLLNRGLGPIKGPDKQELPAYDWRSREGGNKPAYTEYEGNYETNPITGAKTFVPKLDAQGNKIVKTAGRDLDYEAAQAALPEGQDLPEDRQTRIRDIRPTGQGAGPSPRTSAQDLMESARYDADVESAFQSGQITEADRNAQLGSQQRASYAQGFTVESPDDPLKQQQQRRSEVAKARISGDALSQPPAVVRQSYRVDTTLRDLVKQGVGVNSPFSLVQGAHTKLANEIRQNNQMADRLDQGNIGAIAEVLGDKKIRADHPFFQLARNSYGKTIDQISSDYEKQNGKPLFTSDEMSFLQGRVKSASDAYRTDAKNLSDSAGYQILGQALKIAGQQEYNTTVKQRIGKAAIGYVSAIAKSDEIDVPTAQSYFNMSLYGDPTMEMYKDIVESKLEDDSDYGHIFKRGASGAVAKAVAGQGVLRGAAAEIFKTAFDKISNEFVAGAQTGVSEGAVARTGRQSQVKIMNAFLTPFYDSFTQGNNISAADVLSKSPLGQKYLSDLAYNMQVTDTNDTLKTIMQGSDDELKRVVMDQIAAPYGIKRAMQNLFTFDIAGKEDQFEADTPDIIKAMQENDTRTAKFLMAPYASTDQLDTLFGTDYRIQGEGRPRDLSLINLEDMTGAGGSRRQRIETYLANKKSFAATTDKYDSSELRMQPSQLMARILGQYNVDVNAIGGYKGEDRVAYNTGYLTDKDDETVRQKAMSDIETFLSPLKGGGDTAYANDPLFEATLRSLDDTINKLNYNISSGNLDPQQESRQSELLKQLKATRTKALGNLDDFVAHGYGRQHLFRMTENGPDYSQPIQAVGSASRVAQVTDMLAAWVTNTPGVNVNRYFKGSSEATLRRSDMVTVTPVDREGNQIPAGITHQVKPDADGFVKYPVYEQNKEGKWVWARDLFGNPQTTSAPLNKGQQATARLLGKAQTDTNTQGVNASYINTQVNDLRVHLQNIIEPSGADAAERRKYLIEEIGINVDPVKSRITNDDVAKFLQTATPNQGRKLLGWLETYDQSETLRPDARVNWAMNATSTRGKSRGTEGNAITALEKEAASSALEETKSAYFLVAQRARNLVRGITDELKNGIGISDPTTRASANEQTMKSLVKQMPMLGANSPEMAQVRDYLRDYIDAANADDTDLMKVVNVKFRDFVDTLELTPDRLDKAQKELIGQGTQMNIVRPAEEKKLDTKAILEQARQSRAERSAANRAKQTYYHTAFFPELGWIYAEGPEETIKQFKGVESQVKQGRMNKSNVKSWVEQSDLNTRPASSKDIRIEQEKRGVDQVRGGTKIAVKPNATRRVTAAKPIDQTPMSLVKPKKSSPRLGGALLGFGTVLGATQGRRR